MSVTLESFTPPKLARLWQVKPATILEWIRAGELAAFDVAKAGSKRPRYRISRAAAEAFQQRRAAVKPRRKAPAAKPRPEIVDHFPEYN
jgi:predicted site-specific integrase-resolvase